MLKYQVESIEELDETVQSLYTEKDGAYVLTVDGLPQPEDTSGLKNKLNELMTEAKEAKRKARELEESKTQQEEESAKEKGEFKTLWEQAQQRLSEKDEELKQFSEKIQQKDVNIAARSVGSMLAKSDAKRAEVLSDYAAKYARHNGEEVEFIVNGAQVDTNALMAHLTKEYPFLVDGSNATGGGAQSSSGGGASKNVNRTEFDNMSPDKKMAFLKDGGIVED
jgi:DNA repair exonuclease SbcCD ATPase subunit